MRSFLRVEEWLEERKKGLGGSDAPAVLGLCPFRSRHEVYMEKVGLSDGVEESEAMRLGRELEPYLARRFEEETGQRVVRYEGVKDFWRCDDPDLSFMFATPDGWVEDGVVGVEFKTTSRYFAELPPSYAAQVFHYMAVTGASKFYVVVLMGNRNLKIYEVERNEEDIRYLVEQEKEFWEKHVIPRIPPEPDGSPGSRRLLTALVASSPESTVPLFDETLLDRYSVLASQIRELEDELEKVKQAIISSLGGARRGVSSRYEVEIQEKTRVSLDVARLSKEMPEIYETYKKETRYTALRVSELSRKGRGGGGR